MKRIAFILAVCMVLSQTVWARRAKISKVAEDPYRSALVIDADTGKVLFADHPNEVVYPASVLKLMDLLVILDLVRKKQVHLDDVVQITSKASRIGGSQVYLDPRESFSVNELLYALMVQSANDAAVALAIHIAGSKKGFIDLMNKKAQELGMNQTHFYSVHGLPPGRGQKPDETTATDLSILCRELVQRPEALKYTSTKKRGFRDDKFIMRNHNHLLGEVVGCDGLKTGYFAAAGFSIAATAVRKGVRIITIVMGSKDRHVRDSKATELLERGFAQDLAEKTVAGAEVKAGIELKKEANSAIIPDEKRTAVPEPEKKMSRSFPTGWPMFVLGFVSGLSTFAVVFLYRRYRERKRNARYVHHPWK